MKRIMSILTVVSIAMLFCGQAANAGTIDNTAKFDIVTSSVLTDTLCECLTRVDDDDVVRVTIELKDDIDLDNVEQKAVSRAKISSTEVTALNAKTFSLSEKENESVQLVALKALDRVSSERNSILKNHYNAKIESFISSAGLRSNKIESAGLFTPFIRGVSLTKAEIFEIAKNPSVCMIDQYVEVCGNDFDTIDDTYKIVGGNTFIESGYNGSGIRVGLVENYHPDKSRMGSDANNIINVNSGLEDIHATMTSGIIIKFAPSCNVYSYAMKGTGISGIEACSNLIDQYSVHVINMSWGGIIDGKYVSLSREMDYLIRTTKVPVVVAAGNDPYNDFNLNVNAYGLAGNAITVGAVISSGNNPDRSGAYSYPSWSCYRESTPINKPDICAPGKVTIYSLTNEGTSIATPYVTGTAVQMMARNSAFVWQPQKIKAAMLASGTRNGGTSMLYIGSKTSNEEGAGVLDADFCYRVSRAGRSTYFDATSNSGTFTQSVYCDYTTKPFRIACTWEVAATASGTTVNVSDYDMKVYKDGVQVASSLTTTGPTLSKGSNSEIIEIPTSVLNKYGGGYYEVRISRYGSFNGTGTVRIGLAWEQD